MQIHSMTIDEVLSAVDRRIESGRPGYVVTPNVDHVCRFQRDPEVRAIYRDAFLVLPDGVPILWASYLCGRPLKRKLSGSDLVYWLSGHAAAKGYRVFLLGAAEGVAEEAAHKLKQLYPKLIIAGVYSPPLGFEKDQQLVWETRERVRAAEADICYVALGFPKQDAWNRVHGAEADVKVSLGIGASLDFVAGRIRRAPVWMQNLGMEWIWRLGQEPRRLWRRYLLEDTRFFLLLWREWRFWRRQRRMSKRKQPRSDA
jgi:N-acetylglucosaminyldiphosphoundecaprenol N-acetyl-beta-D-mannosaminyltransferase